MKRFLYSAVLFLIFGPYLLAEEVGDYSVIMKGIAYEARNADSMMWVIDRSPSMADDIAEVHRRIEELIKSYQRRGREIPVGIVTFADRPTLKLPPTKDIDQIKKSFGSIKTKGAGKESLFKAIKLAIEKKPRGKKPYFVVVTDESGDDEKELEKVIKPLIKKDIRVLVLSPNASFGNRDWHWDVIEGSKSLTTFYNSQNGPESSTTEALFDFNFVQRSTWSRTINPMEQRVWAVKSGWAPYGLQLIAKETRGKVFELQTDTCQLKTSFSNKEQYSPMYIMPSKDKKAIMKHPWRKAVYDASHKWRKGFKEIDREYPGQSKMVLINGVNAQVPIVKKNIKVTEKIINILDKSYQKPGKSRGYSTEPEKENLRWRANIELAYASALVARYHLHQFLIDVERFHEETFWPDPQNDVCQFNIKIVPYNERLSTDGLTSYGVSDRQKMKKDLISIANMVSFDQSEDIKVMKKNALDALRVVAHNHPDTPWDTMARELYKNLGYYDVYINPCGQWNTGSQSQ